VKTLIAAGAAVVLLPVGLTLLLAAAPTPSCASEDDAGSGFHLDAQQAANARTVVTVGQRLAVPARGQVVAIAAALQESGLRNLAFGDRDSLGIFQQRPSQGWGSPPQILEPAYAATRFYAALLAVRGWQTLPVATAAQAVQRSGYPAAYAQWAGDAAGIVAAVRGAPAASATGCAAAADASTGSMSPATARTVVAFAAAQVGDAYVLGADGPDAWDCSSLVQAAFAVVGVVLPRTAAQQYDWLAARGALAAGPPRLASLRPGDLLLSRGAEPHPATDGEPVGHVALYAGAGMVIEAKGWASGVTAQHYSDAALTSISWVGRLPPPTSTAETTSTGSTATPRPERRSS
jgi:peptidoglycan DL-endopeptidase CwlO